MDEIERISHDKFLEIVSDKRFDAKYLTKDYFLKEFVKSDFYPSQWAIVCALVGFEVLGMYVYGNYYKNSYLLFICYLSTLLAAFLYSLSVQGLEFLPEIPGSSQLLLLTLIAHHLPDQK